MGTNAEPVLGRVFAACDVLSPAARLQLASLLPAVAGQAPALLPAELAACPLPRSQDGRAALRPVIEADLGPEALAQLGGVPLHEVAPAIAGRRDEVDPGPNRARLRNLLERQQATNWAVLGDLTLGDITAWAGMGPGLAATLVGVAVDAGLGFLEDGAASATTPAADAPGPEADDVRLLLGHGGSSGTNALRLALVSYTEPGVPEPVRVAATRLLRLPPPVHPCVAWLDRVLAAAGAHRDRAVFAHGVLRLTDRPTAAAIGEALDVGAERVRQLRARARERVGAAAAQPPSELARIRDALAGRLGAAAPAGAVDDLLIASGLPALPDTRSLLLLWLTGPYAPVPNHPEWLATDPAGLLAETRRLLGDDGGVRPAEQVHKELDVAGVAEEHIGAWLAQQPVRNVDGLLMLTSGTVADIAERVLFAAGRALTVDALEATIWPGRGASPAAERDRLLRVLHRDARFLRVAAQEFELADWGGEPYREVPASPEPAGDACHWLQIEVDEDVLGGATASVPVPLVAALGMQQGTRRTFATRFGPVALVYDGDRPMRGTLRPVALAAGAGLGDVVALGFHAGGGDAVVRLVPVTPLDETA
jgi:hypothetical protein